MVFVFYTQVGLFTAVRSCFELSSRAQTLVIFVAGQSSSWFACRSILDQQRVINKCFSGVSDVNSQDVRRNDPLELSQSPFNFPVAVLLNMLPTIRDLFGPNCRVPIG